MTYNLLGVTDVSMKRAVNLEFLCNIQGFVRPSRTCVYVRIHNVEFYMLTMGSTLHDDHKFDDKCFKLSVTNFRELYNGTIDLLHSLDIVCRK